MYELVTGQDSDDDVSASAKFTAYFDCWQDDSCLYVAKEKSSGTFELRKAGEVFNKDKYSAVWKKKAVGRHSMCLHRDTLRYHMGAIYHKCICKYLTM